VAACVPYAWHTSEQQHRGGGYHRLPRASQYPLHLRGYGADYQRGGGGEGAGRGCGRIQATQAARMRGSISYRWSAGGVATPTPADPCRLPCPRKGAMRRETQVKARICRPHRPTSAPKIWIARAGAWGVVRCTDVCVKAGCAKGWRDRGCASSSPLGRPQHVIYGSELLLSNPR